GAHGGRIPERAPHRADHRHVGQRGLSRVTGGTHPLWRWRTELRPDCGSGRSLPPREPVSHLTHGAVVSAPWFESAFLRVLQHEYASSMHFDATESKGQLPQPPDHPCQLYVHVPFCEALCPFCSFHRVQFREEKARSYFSALREEIRSYHERGFVFCDVYVGGGTPTV